jgi:hypothetical protein
MSPRNIESSLGMENEISEAEADISLVDLEVKHARVTAASV